MTATASAPTRTRRATADGPARKQTTASRGRSSAARGGRASVTRRGAATTTAGGSRRRTATGIPAERRYPVAHALLAAERAVQSNSVGVQLPVIGTVHLPAKEDLVFIGGVVGLAAVGLLEWPVAVLLGVGHTLAANGHNRLMRQFGEALEEA